MGSDAEDDGQDFDLFAHGGSSSLAPLDDDEEEEEEEDEQVSG